MPHQHPVFDHRFEKKKLGLGRAVPLNLVSLPALVLLFFEKLCVELPSGEVRLHSANQVELHGAADLVLNSTSVLLTQPASPSVASPSDHHIFQTSMCVVCATTLPIKEESGTVRVSGWHGLQVLVLLVWVVAAVLPAVLVDLLHDLDIVFDGLELLLKEALLLSD